MTTLKIICCLIRVLAILTLSSSAHSLMVDFQPSAGVTQAGYTAVTHVGQTVDGLRFWFVDPVSDTDMDGEPPFPQFWYRGGVSNSAPDFTTADLLNDFAFSYGPILYFTTSGLSANGSYDVRFFSSDLVTDVTTDLLRTTFSALPLYSSGSDVSITRDRMEAPTRDRERSILGQSTTGAEGYLAFEISTAYVSGGIDAVSTVLNALEINPSPVSAVPEPTTLLLLGICLIGLAGLSRRKLFK